MDKRKTISLQDVHNLVKKRNGKYLECHYINSKTKMRFQCENGHIWKASFCSIKYGRWCPKCSRKKKI